MVILCNGRDCTPGHCTEAAVAMVVWHQVACPCCALAYVYVPLTDCPVTVATVMRNPCIAYYYIRAYWLHHWT